jgi:SAM-dependent methyltransferase
VSNDPDGSIALDDYRWLTGSEAEKCFAIADSLAAAGASLIRVTQQLRAELPPARVHLLLQQRELRLKAREKFLHAENMFFTPRGLEQATDAAVAAYKASRFPPDQTIADFCCGIGGDLLALARRGPVIGVDRDPVAVLLAEANAQAVLDRVGTVAFRFETTPVDSAMPICSEISAWHIDPDRRPGGGRTTQVKLHEPGPDVLARLLEVCPHGAIKLAPAADLVEQWWADAELEWISRRRQCRQLVAWFGRLAEHPGRRRATVIRNTSDFSPDIAATFVGEPNVEIALAPKIGRYVFEPDPAVLAAKLEGDLARKYEVSAVTPSIAYFTGDRPIRDAAFDGFEVLEVLPYHVREIKAWLTARHIGRLEIKKRDVPLEPDKVRRELAGVGDQSATVLLAKIGGRVQAIVVRRLEK